MKNKIRSVAAILMMTMALLLFTACSGRTYNDAKTTGQIIKLQKSLNNQTVTVPGDKILVTPADDNNNNNNNGSTVTPSDDNNNGNNETPDDDNNKNNNGNNETPDDNNNNNNNNNGSKDDDQPYSTSCMSFNVLAYDTHSTGYAAPSVRADYIIKTIQKYDPDLLGCQEVMAGASQNGNFDTYSALNNALTSYSHRALIEEAGSATKALNIASGLVIYYKTNRFEVKDHGAKVYNADSARHYQWIKFYDKQEKVSIIMTNTHFSINPNSNRDAGIQLRANEANELLAFWKKMCGTNIALYATGDYNHTMDENAYTVLSGANFSSSRDISEKDNANSSIDFVYVNNKVQGCYQYIADKTEFDNANPNGVENTTGTFTPKKRASDHAAIIAYCYNY